MTATSTRRGPLRASPRLTTLAHVAPALLAVAGTAAWLYAGLRDGTSVTSVQLTIATVVVLVGIATGAVLGGFAAVAQRRIVDDLDHDLRMPMTIIRGQVELVLSRDDASASDRKQSSQAVIAETERLERILRQTE